MKKNLIYLSSFLLIGLVLMSFNNHSKTAYLNNQDNHFKNLKVLPKNISKDSLMGLMEGYNKALGVKCSYCHIKDKAADSIMQKEITRHMIHFTNELNAKEFAPIGKNYKNAVECATCHRGSTKPMSDTKAFMNGRKNKNK